MTVDSSLFQTVPTAVVERFDNGWAAAMGAYETAELAVLRLQNIAEDLRLINRTISIDTTGISAADIEAVPPTLDLSLLNVNVPAVPSAPSIINATMGSFPEYPDLVVGDIPAPNETYSTALLTALKAKFLADVQSGGTGISPAIENAIFSRQSERDLILHNDTMDELAATAAKGGYPMPGGAILATQAKATLDFYNKRLDVSRDVSIKSFELAFQHTQFILQQGVAFESHLMDWAHSVAALASDVATKVVDAQIKAFAARTDGIGKKIMGIIEEAKAKIDYNKGLIEIFNGQVNAYAAQLRGEGDRVNAVSRAYEAETGLFRSTADFEIQKAGLDLKVLDARMSQALANANLLIKDKEIEARNYEVLNNLKMEAMKAAGSISAQLVAGAMAGISAQAHMSAGATVGFSASARWMYNEATGEWEFSFGDL